MCENCSYDSYKSDGLIRRESFGSTFTRRGSSSTNPKVIVPRKRIILARTVSDGSSYSKASVSSSQNQLTSLQLVAEGTLTSNTLTCTPTTAPVTFGSDNIYFPPDFHAIQNKRFS